MYDVLLVTDEQMECVMVHPAESLTEQIRDGERIPLKFARTESHFSLCKVLGWIITWKTSGFGDMGLFTLRPASCSLPSA